MVARDVLFIGNSYTHCNDLPWIVAQLAASAEQALRVAMVAPGGVTLAWHCQNPETKHTIQQGGWDYVVLQEFSTRPIEDVAAMYRHAEILHKIIAATGAQTMLYMTWARQHKPEMQAGLTTAYTDLARALGAQVAPVGLAWQAALAQNAGLVLHTADKSHPTPTGSYLTACVFYATLFASSPVGLTSVVKTADEQPLLGLPEAEARFLQTVAWETVNQFDVEVKV